MAEKNTAAAGTDIETLKADLKKANEKAAAAETKAAQFEKDLKAANKKANEAEDKASQLEEIANQNLERAMAAEEREAALNTELEGALRVNDELQERLEVETIKAKSEHPLVQHEGIFYEVRSKVFNFGGVDYKAEELQDHPEVITILLAKKSGILKAIEPEA